MESPWYPYEPVIGLEVHVRLDLSTKIFSADPYTYGQDPNTLISPISLAYPGTLPKVNKKAIEFAIKMGLACKSQIASEVTFDRKNYFYPDLPKGYQLTQDRNPICKSGRIPIKSGSGYKEIELTKTHLEEDAGKSIHVDDGDFTQVDFNRAGTALIEIVTEPVIGTPDEAYSFMYEVRRLVRALHIGDGNMEQGSLRCDANVSVRKAGETQLGTKVEIKNVNSFNNVKRAISLEIDRQIKLLDSGEEINSDSRSFDPTTGKTHSMRTKETLTDYRYFPDPDLTSVIVDDAWKNSLEKQMPELPIEKEIRYQNEYSLSSSDARVLTDNSRISRYFEEVLEKTGNAKVSANWIMGPVKSVLNEQNIEIEELPLSSVKLAQIINSILQEKISQNLALKQLFPAAMDNPDVPIEKLLEDLTGLEQESHNINEVVNKLVAEFPKEAELLKNGKMKLMGMFMGKIMKETKGTADPKKTKEILMETLNIK